MIKLLKSCVILVMCPVLAYSGGLFLNIGAKASGMAGAFVAVADDVSAIYWNPAGLVQMKNSTLSYNHYYSSVKVVSNTSLKNVPAPDEKDGDFPLPRVYPTEPAQYNSKELSTNSSLFFLGGCTQAKDIKLAGGIYVIGGGGGKWEDSVKAGVDDIDALANGSFGFVISNISAAKTITPELSVGLGLNYIYSMETINVRKDYTKEAGSLMPASYLLQSEMNSSGNGIQFVLGSMYSPVEKLRLGLCLKNSTALNISGKAHFTRNGLAALGLPDTSLETHYNQTYSYPATYSVGAAYDLIEPLTLSLGVTYSKYSELKNVVDYENGFGVYADKDESKNYKDTTQVMVGAEYRVNPFWSVRGGLQNDPGPAPTDKLTLLETKIYSHNAVFMGFGYNIKSFNVDFCYGYSFSNKPEKSGREYELNGGSYRLAAGYSF